MAIPVPTTKITRMTQRTGSAALWASANTILAKGEIGFELDTNKYKIGNGTSHWNDLSYFVDESETQQFLLDSVPELIPDGINNTLIAGNGIIKEYDSNTKTITISVDSNPIDTSSLQTQIDSKASITELSSHEADTTNIHGITDTAALATKTYADSAVSTAVLGLTKSSVGLSNVDNTSDINKPISTATQSALNEKAPITDADLTGTTTTENLVINGDLTINGGAFQASATSITIDDNIVQLANQNPANTVDLGLVVAYNDGSTKHSGIVRDVSENTWKLFKGVSTEPSTTVQFSEGTLDNLEVNTLTGNVIGNITGNVSGNAGTVTDGVYISGSYSDPSWLNISKSKVELSNVDNTSDINKPISTSTQAALNLKANLSAPTFTGTVTLPSTTSIGTISATEIGYIDGVTSSIQTQLNNKQAIVSGVSDTEIGYLDGVTSAIQTQLDSKLSSITAASTYQPLVANVSDTEIGYLDGVTSSIQTQINSKLSSTTAASTYQPLDSDLTAIAAVPTGTGLLKNTAGTWSLDTTSYSPLAGSSSITTVGTITSGTWSGSFGAVSGANLTSLTAANISSGTLGSGVVASSGTTTSAASGIGYMGMPQVTATTGNVTVAAADAGKHNYSTATRTITIDSNANLALPIGTTLVFVAGSGATVTIAITTDTMYLAGVGTTGSRTLAPFGMATAVKVAATTWFISGNGLS